MLLLSKPPPYLSDLGYDARREPRHERRNEGVAETRQLVQLGAELSSSTHTLTAAYGEELIESVDVLMEGMRSHTRAMHSSEYNLSVEDQEEFRLLSSRFRAHLRERTTHFDNIHSRIAASLAAHSRTEVFLSQGGLWPQATLGKLLQTMTRAGGWPLLSEKWRRALVILCFACLRRQRARRLLRICLRRQVIELEAELKNPGSLDEGIALQHPDWLLIQVSDLD